MELIDLPKAKKLIRSLLISCPRGMPAKDLAADFRNTMGRPLPFQDFGYRSLDEFIKNIPDVVRVLPGPNGETYYYGVATAETQHVARLVATQKKPPARRSVRPQACVRPTGFTRKGFAGPRARQGWCSAEGKRAPTVPTRFNRFQSSNPAQRGPYKPLHVPGSIFPSYGKSGHNPSPLLPSPYPPSSPHLLPHPSLCTSSTHYPLTITRTNTCPSQLMSHHRPMNIQPLRSIDGAFQRCFPLSPATPPRTVTASPVTTSRPFPASPVTTSRPFPASPVTTSRPFPASPVTTSQPFPAPSFGHSTVHPPPTTSWLSVAPPPGFTFVHRPPTVTPSVCSTPHPVVHSLPVCSTPRPYVPPPPGFSPRPPPLPHPPHSQHPPLITNTPPTLHAQSTSLTISRSNSIPLLHLLPPNSPEPSRTVVLPAGGERPSDVSPSALIKAKQPGARPDTASNQNIKQQQFSPKGSISEVARQQQLSPKGSQNLSLSDMVRQLLEEKPNGIWIKRLKKELESKFKGANIPDDVGSFVVEMPFVQTDYPIPTNPIIYLKKQVVDVVEKGRSDSSSSKGEVCEKEAATVKTKWPALSMPAPTQPQAKSPLPLPSTVRLDDEFFDVVVTCINSPIDFYVQKCENDKLLLELQEGLGTYCTSNVPKVASQVVPNTLYAYLWADQEAQRNYWCRVLVVSCSDQKADVMFPDYGDTKVLPYKDLKELPSQFYELPFQAVQCSLHGVSDTTEAASLKFIELADQELCVAQVMNSSGHRCALELIPSNAEPGAETINSTILKLSQPISSLKPQLPNPGQPMVPVKLTDVDEDGVVSVQLLGPGLTYLDQLLTEMNNPNSRTRKEGKPMGFVTQRSVGAVCCAPFMDGTWYRAQIKKLISLKKVLVEYVDFGNEEEVDLNTTTLILPSTSDLFSLPFQAVKCTVHGLPPAGCSWTEASIEALTEFFDSGEMLLQVVKKPDNGGLPSIKLFFLTNEEEGGQMDVGEYLLSQGLFSHPHTVSQPLVPAAIPKTASLPSMKIVVTGQSGSDESYTRMVTVLQDDRTGAAQPAPQGPVERPQKGHSTSPPPSYEAVIEHSEKSPSHSRSSSKSSQNTASSLTDALDSGIQSLQITPTVLTESPRTSPPPLAGLPSPPQATPKYVHSSSTTMQKSPPQAIPLSPPPLYNITSSPICTPPQSIASSSSSSRHISPSPQSSCLKVPPPSDVATPHITPSQTPAVSPITSPPSLSPYRHTAVKRRVFGDNPVAVHVTNAKSPDHFTVQLDSEQSQLAVLQEMLQDKVEPLQGSVAMGTLYCAQFSDQNWYRCTVIERLPCEMVWVQFVDYGDEKMLHISALRGLPLSISDLPIYGVTCVLAGAVPLDDNWSDSAIDFFTKRVFGKVFYALFKECSPDVYYVALTDTTSLVAQDLVTNGFAKVSI